LAARLFVSAPRFVYSLLSSRERIFIMTPVGAIAVLTAVFTLPLSALPAEGPFQGQSKNGHKVIHVVVTSVQAGGKNGQGSITVKTHGGRSKGGAATAGQGGTTTVAISAHTKVARVARGGSGQSTHEKATLADLHEGDHVLIVESSKHAGTAKAVAILSRK